MATKNFIQNPFFTGINIPEKYFCGREKEKEDIIRLLENGNNIVLKAPRRTGKTALIKHILNQPDVNRHYNTMYVDILGTTNASEFIRCLQNEIFKQQFSLPAKTLEKAKNILNNITLEPSYDITSGMFLPKFGLNPVKNIELSLETLFGIIRETDKPNIMVIDEFQQIENYPENMTAILRSYIQQCPNTKFIFSGSEPHMLTSMFLDKNRPFYNSAISMNLDIIPEKTYTEFCSRKFKEFNRDIHTDTIEFVYNLFCGNTYQIQKTINLIFSLTEKWETADTELARKVIEQELENREQEFRETINGYPNEKERKVLFCIANEGIVTEIHSKEMIQKYKLGTPSIIQNAINNLTNSKKTRKSAAIACTIAPNVYKLIDKYLELWIVKDLPSYQYKLNNAKELFQKEKETIKHFHPGIVSKHFINFKP